MHFPHQAVKEVFQALLHALFFPLRWDTGAGSTNVLCYTKPISPPVVTPGGDSLLAVEASQHIGRYVNITEAGGRPLLERDGTSSPRPLNYAEVGVGSEPETSFRAGVLLLVNVLILKMVQ
ncbi:hypothetical protein OSTOST_26217 [Ostertagia ostertagi]